METPIRNFIPECPFAIIEKFEIYEEGVCTSPMRTKPPERVEALEPQRFRYYCCSKLSHPFCKYYPGKEEIARPESDKK